MKEIEKAKILVGVIMKEFNITQTQAIEWMDKHLPVFMDQFAHVNTGAREKPQEAHSDDFKKNDTNRHPTPEKNTESHQEPQRNKVFHARDIRHIKLGENQNTREK